MSIRSRWGESSLRSRLIVLTTLAFSVVLAAVGVVSTLSLQESARQALNERQVLAGLLAERVETQLVTAQEALGHALLDERLDMEDGNLDPEVPWLGELHESAGLFKRIVLLDAGGRVLLTAPFSPDLTGRNMSSAPYSVGLPVTADPVILPAAGRQTGMPGLRMIQPIRSPKGGTSGYLLGWIDTGDPRALPLLYPYAPGQGGSTDLVDASGRVLLSSDAARVGLATDHAGHFAALVKARRASAGTCHSCHDQGLSRANDLLAFAPLAVVPWGIAVRQPEELVFAAARGITRDLTALALVILIVFTGLVSASTRSLARPLEKLARACRQIAHGDLTEPIATGGPAETRALAASFEKMRQDLLAYRTETEGARRELERRVDERTSELRLARDHLVRTNRNLVVLNSVATILGQSLDLSGTLSMALTRTAEAVGADEGAIFVTDAHGEPFLAAHHGLAEDKVSELRGLPATGAGRGAPGRWPADAIPDAELARQLAAVTNSSDVACLPLAARGSDMGRLCVIFAQERRLTDEDRALLASVGAQMALAVRNSGLYDALQREESARAELLHKVIVAQEDERKRVARELHDETSQAITALMLGLDTAGLALAHSPEAATDRLAATRTVAEGMLQNIHRLISDLRPAMLDDLGLVAAISWYAEQRLNPAGIAFHSEYDGMDTRLPPHVETAVFRVAQEALTNVVRHADAANIWLSMVQRGSHLTLQIRDDGKGIANGDWATLSNGGGVGLQGMRERVNLLGGDFRLDTVPGLGTTIAVHLPIPRSTTPDIEGAGPRATAPGTVVGEG